MMKHCASACAANRRHMAKGRAKGKRRYKRRGKGKCKAYCNRKLAAAEKARKELEARLELALQKKKENNETQICVLQCLSKKNNTNNTVFPLPPGGCHRCPMYDTPRGDRLREHLHYNPNGPWTIIDGWYFSVLTLGTVGYGVLVPSNDWTRACVIANLSLGLAFSLFTMGIITEIFLKRFEEALEATKIQEKKWVFFDVRALGIVMVLFFLMLLGVLYGMIWEKWSFLISLYWVFATVTTVGYGDFAPSTQNARAIISFYILAGAGLFAAILTLVIASYLAVQKRAMAVRFLLGNLSLENMVEAAKEVDPDNPIITRHEFHQFMLVQMGYIDRGIINLVNDAFDRLDVDGSGTLTMDDIGADTKATRAKMLAELRVIHNVGEEDEKETPSGFLGLKLRFKT